jgi:hypothetical protein
MRQQDFGKGEKIPRLGDIFFRIELLENALRYSKDIFGL